MSDKHSPEQRSFNMSRIKGRDTAPEMMVRKYLFSRGLRYRKNDKRYPGKPDLVLPKYKTAIFVNGCFWHMHEGCPYFVMPKTNQSYWKPKLERNRARDQQHVKEYDALGWQVIIVWECELKKRTRKSTLEMLYERIVKHEETALNDPKR